MGELPKSFNIEALATKMCGKELHMRRRNRLSSANSFLVLANLGIIWRFFSPTLFIRSLALWFSSPPYNTSQLSRIVQNVPEGIWPAPSPTPFVNLFLSHWAFAIQFTHSSTRELCHGIKTDLTHTPFYTQIHPPCVYNHTRWNLRWWKKRGIPQQNYGRVFHPRKEGEWIFHARRLHPLSNPHIPLHFASSEGNKKKLTIEVVHSRIYFFSFYDRPKWNHGDSNWNLWPFNVMSFQSRQFFGSLESHLFLGLWLLTSVFFI